MVAKEGWCRTVAEVVCRRQKPLGPPPTEVGSKPVSVGGTIQEPWGPPPTEVGSKPVSVGGTIQEPWGPPPTEVGSKPVSVGGTIQCQACH